MLDDYIEYLRSINSEIYRNGVRLPLNLDSDYAQVSRSVGILDDFLYYNRILSLCGSTYKIKSLSSGSEVLYSEVMKSEFFAEFMERRQNLRDSEQIIPADPMAQHSEVQMLSSVLRNFENSEYSNSEEKLKSVGVDDFMSRFVIEPVEFEGDDDVNNYEDYEEEEYPVDAQGNRVSEEEYIDSDDLVFDNYDDLDNESVSDDVDSPYEDDLEFDNYDDLDSLYEDESDSDSYDMSDVVDSPYEDDLEFDSYNNESEEGYVETDDTADYGVSYEGIDEDDELLLGSLASSVSDDDIFDSLSSLSGSAEDIDADFGFDSSDDALGFDTEISDYEDSYGIDDNYDFEAEEIEEDDDSYEEDAFGFDDIDSPDEEDEDVSSDYDEDMYRDLDNEDEGEDNLPDEDSNYFDSYLDDDEEYYGYDDFERDTSRVYDESEIFNSGSSVNLKTQINSSVQSTSTPSAQSRDSDEVMADALSNGLSKVLKFGKSRLQNSGLLDKDTK